MSAGWFDSIEEADAYFQKKYGAGDWKGLDLTTQKTPLLETAFNWIGWSNLFSIPPEPTAEQKVILQKAQAEMAWFLYKNNEDMEPRMALRTQGVFEAGIVKEKYSKHDPTLPIPPIVLNILQDFRKVGATATGTYFAAVDIE
ncbi:MAG: hypothetical protein KAW12_07230 [Candidatus Aminicenantes bacterium]|nr:hypothetical protein [Candidatus Aminicenantes bacterium]